MIRKLATDFVQIKMKVQKVHTCKIFELEKCRKKNHMLLRQINESLKICWNMKAQQVKCWLF